MSVGAFSTRELLTQNTNLYCSVFYIFAVFFLFVITAVFIKKKTVKRKQLLSILPSSFLSTQLFIDAKSMISGHTCLAADR